MAFPYTNLLRAGTWATGGPGSVTVDPITGAMTVVADGSGLVFARKGVTTEVNRRYQLSWSQDSSTIIFRQVGSAVGLSDIVAANVAVTGDNKIEFTAISTTTWVSFQRTTAATVRISSIILQEIPTSPNTSRRLNGLNQYFSIDAVATGLRVANNNWFIGGWISFTYMPDAAIYFMDFGRTDPAGTGGGAGRCRLFFDPTANKVACSTAESNGSSYRENYIIATLVPDAWYYVGMIASTNADARLVFGNARGPSYIGTAIPPVSAAEVCRFLQLGARTISPRTNFAPCRYSHWMWTSGWIPTDVAINAWAADTAPPTEPVVTTPAGATTYYWPMSAISGNELSTKTAADMVSNSTYGSPVVLVGPSVPTVQAAVVTPLDIMVI